MKDQQPPAQNKQARDNDPSTYGSSPDEPTVPSNVPARSTAREAPSWFVPISQFITRHPPKRRMLVLGAIIVGVLAFIFGLQSPSPSKPSQTTPDTKQFAVTNQPTLVFKHSIANVNIVPGPSNQVSIKEKRSGETDSITIHYTQHGDTITVTVDIASGLMEDTWVDFDVIVPRGAGLTTTVATGTLEARDLNGPIMLGDTNGAIWATNLTGSINLKTQSGSINLANVSGQVTVATQNGTITATATHLQGHSTIRASSGTINFHGSLSRTGSYLFQNSNGAVGLTLPSSSVFALAAHTATGSINTDFTGVTVSYKNGHAEARGAVGSAPHAQLTVQTGGGSIDLHRGG